MGDLIDRQDAVNVLCDNCDHAQAVCPHYPCKQYTKIEQLPSAQPTQPNTPNTLEALDCISRQDAIEAIYTWDMFGVDERGRLVRWHEGLEPYVHLRDVLTAIVNLPSVQSEKLTDKEQRIFLSAMGREEKVCEEVDRNYVREPYEDSLMYVCKEIKRKVKGVLWTL